MNLYRLFITSIALLHTSIFIFCMEPETRSRGWSLIAEYFPIFNYTTQETIVHHIQTYPAHIVTILKSDAIYDKEKIPLIAHALGSSPNSISNTNFLHFAFKETMPNIELYLLSEYALLQNTKKLQEPIFSRLSCALQMKDSTQQKLSTIESTIALIMDIDIRYVTPYKQKKSKQEKCIIS